MYENSVEIEELSGIFGKTLLEISILDSLYGSSEVSDVVKNVFQASIEDLRSSESLRTLATVVGDNHHEHDGYRGEPELSLRKQSNSKYLVQEYISSEKQFQLLKRNEEEIDLMTERCNVSIFLITHPYRY